MCYWLRAFSVCGLHCLNLSSVLVFTPSEEGWRGRESGYVNTTRPRIWVGRSCHLACTLFYSYSLACLLPSLPPGFSLWFGMGKLCRLNILIWSVRLAEWDPLGQLAWYWAWRPPMNLDNFPHDSITHHLPCYMFICLVPRPLKVNGDGRVLVRWMYL